MIAPEQPHQTSSEGPDHQRLQAFIQSGLLHCFWVFAISVGLVVVPDYVFRNGWTERNVYLAVVLNLFVVAVFSSFLVQLFTFLRGCHDQQWWQRVVPWVLFCLMLSLWGIGPMHVSETMGSEAAMPPVASSGAHDSEVTEDELDTTKR